MRMCGSFQQPGSIRILEEFARLSGVPVSVLSPAGPPTPEAGDRTLRPFNDVLVVFLDEAGELRLAPMYWQLIHYWEKEFKSKYTCFNTRVESLQKPHNQELLIGQRCILPVVSFFENRQENGQTVKPRQVYEFSLPRRELMALGGIYSIWSNPQNSEDRRLSCSIITVESNRAVGEIHNRMPFVVPPAEVNRWLNRSPSEAAKLKKMIRPYEGELGVARIG